MHKPYLIWLLIFVLLPTALLWVGFYDVLRKYPKTYFRGVLGSMVVGVTWDLFAVKTHIWSFPGGCCLAHPGVLPYEEYLFIFFVAIYMISVILILRHRVIRHRW